LVLPSLGYALFIIITLKKHQNPKEKKNKLKKKFKKKKTPLKELPFSKR